MTYRSLALMLLLTTVGCQLFRSGPRSNVALPTAPEKTAHAATLNGTKAGAVAISPANTKIEFTGSNLLTTQTGYFANFQGTLELKQNDPTGWRIHVDIDMDSTTTSIDRLTKHLKAEDFFDVAKYPKAEFDSDRILPSAELGLHQITGKLKFHGTEKMISFPARLDTTGDRISLEATVTIKQSDFGMTDSVKLTRDEVKIKVSLKAAKP